MLVFDMLVNFSKSEEVMWQWNDGTISSLQQWYHLGRPLILSKQQVNQLVTKVVRSHDHHSRPVNYIQITNDMRQKSNMNIYLRTVQRYGRKSDIKSKKIIQQTYTESEYKNSQSLSLNISLFVFHLFHLQLLLVFMIL